MLCSYQLKTNEKQKKTKQKKTKKTTHTEKQPTKNLYLRDGCVLSRSVVSDSLRLHGP